MAEKLSTANRGKPIRCRAAVCRKPSEPLVIEEIIVAPPMPHEVRIRIIYTSLCHSDLSFWKIKDFPGMFPIILGHEAIGVVESVGEDVNEVSEGDTVIPTFMSHCGECVDCRSTKSNLCSKFPKVSQFMPRYETSRFTDLNGEVAEGARLCGATRIIGVDVNQGKFEIGKKFGLTDFINTANCENKSASEVIIEMTDGGADYCFECVGLASLMQEAYACCRKGWGKTIVLGVDKPGSHLSLPTSDVLISGKTLTGCLFGGLKPKSDIPVLLNRYMNKELQLDEFVTHEVTFEDINKAFDLLIEGKCLRCVICMNDQ